MSKKTYCIVKIYDYKGGELDMMTNLSHESFISELAESFEDISFPDNSTVDEMKTLIINEINNDDFQSLYAGGDGFSGELYQVVGGEMTEVNFSDFATDIAVTIFGWINK